MNSSIVAWIALLLLLALGIAAPAQAVVVGGSVTLLADGQPAVGAQVRLLRIVAFSEELVAQQAIGATGTYSFSDPVTGSFVLRVELPGHVPARRNFGASDNTPIVVDFSLSLPSSLTVAVVDATTQLPVANAPVRVTYDDGSVDVLASDAQGRSEFAGISGGPVKVCVVSPDDDYRNECYENQFLPPDNALDGIAPYALGSGANATISIQLNTGSRLSGTLTDRYFMQPIDGQVTLTFYSTAGTGLFSVTRVTQANGDYEVGGLAPGSYHVGAGGFGNNYYTPRVHPDIDCVAGCTVTNGTLFTLDGTDAATDVDFDLHPGAVALGSVTETGTGAPIVGASVVGYLQFITFIERTRTMTDASGQFVLAHIRPEALRLGTDRVSTHINEAWPNVPCYTLQCGQGQSVSFGVDQVVGGFDFVLDAAGSIRGSITDAQSGAPLAAQLNVRNQSGTINFLLQVPAQPSDYASLGLPPGTYYAAAQIPQIACEVWQEQACAFPVPIDTALATPIVISGTAPANNIDFTLDELPLFADGFEGFP